MSFLISPSILTFHYHPRLIMEARPSEEQSGRCPADLCGRSAALLGHSVISVTSLPRRSSSGFGDPTLAFWFTEQVNGSERLGHLQQGTQTEALGGPAFLRTNSEVCSQKSSFFSPLSSVLCLLVAAGVAAAALMHTEGAFEESTSVLLFHPLCTSPYLRPSVFSLRFCPYLSLKTLCIPSFNFCFSHSHLPALGPVPSSFLMILFFSFLLLSSTAG